MNPSACWMWNTRFLWGYRHFVIYCPRWIARVLSINHIITSFSAFTPFSVGNFHSDLIGIQRAYISHWTNKWFDWPKWAELRNSMSSEDVMTKLKVSSCWPFWLNIKFDILALVTHANRYFWWGQSAWQARTVFVSLPRIVLSNKKSKIRVKYVILLNACACDQRTYFNLF